LLRRRQALRSWRFWNASRPLWAASGGAGAAGRVAPLAPERGAPRAPVFTPEPGSHAAWAIDLAKQFPA
jgi:hypothetical protein